MQWFERMNRAIDYIEENLDGIVDYNQIARLMQQPALSVQRTFSIITNTSLSDYIRKRRLTLAAFELQNGDEKIIDIATKYGYESPEAFTRAFKEIHGVPPNAARSEGVSLKTFPRVSFLLTVKGATPMSYRIESRESFGVYGIEGIISTEENANQSVPMFWQACENNGQIERLRASTLVPPSGIHAICCYRDTGRKSFPYMIFTYQTRDSNTAGFTKVRVPASTWAIFRSDNHTEEETVSTIQMLNKRVYTDWLPTSGYEKIDGFELELYHGTDDGMYFCETWVRVASTKKCGIE